MTHRTGLLTRKTLFCYSAGSVVETSIYGFCGLYLLNFYTDVVGLGPKLVANALALRFLLDAISDPAVGYFSDHTRSARGRRRPFFLVGAVPAAVLFYLLFVPPALSTAGLVIFLTLISAALYLSLTVVGVPYMALSWELTPDYDQRTRISVYRRGMEVVAEVLAILSIPLLLSWIAAGGADAEPTTEQTRRCYQMAAFGIGSAAVMCAVVAYAGTSGAGISASRQQFRFVDGIRTVFRNKPFVILLVTFTLVAVADRAAMALLYYLLEHFHGVPKQDATLLLLTFFAGSLSTPGLWQLVSAKIGKKAGYMLAMASWAVVFSSFAAHAWSTVALYCVVFLMGVVSTGVLTMPGAIAPDIIEWDQMRSGQRREGIYAGVTKFSWKLGTAACFFVLGYVLEGIGYRGDEATSPEVLYGLRITFAGLPSVLLAAAIGVFWFFPITRQSHEAMVRELKSSQDD
jgi:GPH family glycoside/pentoside/hexuronide:cation symporter